MERTFQTPLGVMCVTEKNGSLVSFDWEEGGTDDCPVLIEAEKQVNEYFTGKRRSFDLPLAPVGTPFQHSVWNALLEVPYGEMQTYAQIARRINSPKAFRAVGMACNRNPLPVFIPCHRIIGSSGQLTGYAGGLDRKKLLLDLENARRSF